MPRILSIDYGSKRTGIAVTDPLQIIASSLTTVESSTAINFIVGYCAKEAVEKIIIGLPKNLDNTATDATPIVVNFTSKLKTALPLMPVVMVDERFSSKMAEATMLQTGLKKMQRRDKQLVDRISATILLQEYLNRTTIS